MSNKNYIYFFIALIIFIALKGWYTRTDHDQLLFILKPTNALVELFTGASSVYHSERGYYYQALNITIEKSCSGFNFWLLSFDLFVFVSLTSTSHAGIRVFIIPGMLLLSYLLTIFVNASRILTSIKVNEYTNPFSDHPIAWLHQAEGVFIYLLFLTLFYYGLNFLYTQKKHAHEETTSS